MSPGLRSLLLASLLLSSCGPKAEPSRSAAAAPPDSAPAVAPPVAQAPDTTKPTPAAAPPAAAPQASPKPSPAKPATMPPPSAKTPAKPAAAPAPSEATAQAPDPYHPPPRDTLDAETYQGWKQYELNCSRCHGEYAVGTSFAPALVVSLKEGGTIPTQEAFITTVCAGRLDKGMPSWCALGLEMSKIEEMYRYVKGRADGHIAAGRPALREP